MIDLLNHWSRLWAEYFGLVVAQNTIFLGLIFLLLTYLKNAPARTKYIISTLGLIKLLLPPFLPASFLGARLPLFMPEFTTTVTISPLPIMSEGFTAPKTQLNLLGFLFILWLGCAVLYILFSLISTLRLKMMLRNASPLSDKISVSIINDRKIRLCKSAKISMPLTMGIRPRKIFVPVSWDLWPRECRKMILQHEMAHIKRHDGLIQAFQILAQALYIFHPMVLLLNRRIREYREMACDDASIGSEKRSTVKYSRYLVEIAEKITQNTITCESVSALIRQKNELLNRVQYQMKEETMRVESKKKTNIILGSLILLTLPLSWYHSKEKPKASEAVATPQQTATAQADNPPVFTPGIAKPSQDIQIIEISLKADSRILINGESTTLSDLKKSLKVKIKGDPAETNITLKCDPEITMGTISDLQKALLGLNVRKIGFQNDSGESVPYNLPPEGTEERIQAILQKNVDVILINRTGQVMINVELVDISMINDLMKKHNLMHKNDLIVSIKPETETKYRDFLNVLNQVKTAGVNRIFISEPEITKAPPPRR
ncbi:MAG: M56 family metallopeptidase [bacterium]